MQAAMAGQGDSPTSPIDVLVAVTASRRLSMGGRPSGTLSATRLGSVSEEYPVHGGKEPSCGSGSLERPNTADASSKSGSLLGSPPAKGIGGERLLSGVPLQDLFILTNDPLLQKRVMKADTNRDGRIGRREILNAIQSEATAKKKLKWGLIIGGALLVFCLLMLAANAALTYVVVSMSKDTSVQTSGVMTDKSGSTVVGTAVAAEITDLLYAYHTPADAAASLLGLKELLITTGNDTVAAYQVLSASLVTGQRLDFVVAAPTHDAGAAGGTAAGRPAAELMRIVISEAGVFEVRGGGDGGDGQGAGSGRRLLQQLSNGQLANPKVQGQLSSTATSTCGTSGGTCSPGTASVGCPRVPTCGTNRVRYGSPCEARLAGTSVLCSNCGNPCPDPATYRPSGLPPNLSWDGPGFVRTSPPPPRGGTASAAGQPDGTPGGSAGQNGQAGSNGNGGVGSGGSPGTGTRPSGWPSNLAIDGVGFKSPPPPKKS
ncbi:hypothetical protein CHLNCDRAFT_134501 [Chlorella variabilis]|uniref:EF-hand domain-containing protein n=1 Tax=Chlorella variabilis TaxID=554065 RepID=E1ZG40_CHLVA|nr:hypothetical protein CHLNCDRAFT_134501 [Chlorella variabilis]EFN55396.1 hypothetical protein CHLNCDRAFT_134501 [Chlorella variabilis]|eukprot:XP_005847498.1 hypothetical protein CHLNCDRAFT_134501 [Chlorella variabilis]